MPQHVGRHAGTIEGRSIRSFLDDLPDGLPGQPPAADTHEDRTRIISASNQIAPHRVVPAQCCHRKPAEGDQSLFRSLSRDDGGRLLQIEIDLVQSLFGPVMVKRYASVFVSAGFGALATSAEYPAWVTECHQIPNCYPDVTYYAGGLEALLSVGAGAELGIIPQLPLTGRAQMVFTLGDQQPGRYLRFGLGALWRLR